MRRIRSFQARWTLQLACWAASCAPLLSEQARADPPVSSEPLQVEVWSGLDATSNAVSAFAGATYAPDGSLSSDGFRIRAVAGLGRYQYSAFLTGPSGLRRRNVIGDSEFADVLLGYQVQTGLLTIKTFAGLSYSEHTLAPRDPANQVVGSEFGAKLALETWLNIGNLTWSSADLSYSTAHGEFSSRLRFGYRLTENLSIGPEAGAFGNKEFTGGRGGGFVRYEWSTGELSLSGGVSGDIAEPSNPYGLLNVTHKF